MAADRSIPILRTKRLVLRPTAPLDLDAFHLLQLDGAQSRFGRRAPSSVQESEDRLVRLLVRQADGELAS